VSTDVRRPRVLELPVTVPPNLRGNRVPICAFGLPHNVLDRAFHDGVVPAL
jgi:hypothetical protein